MTRAEARRIAVRAQLLDASRPGNLLTLIQQLTFLQLDPTDAVAPSADLVAWSRLGSTYAPAQLREALEHERTIFEHCASVAMVRPMADLGLYRAEMAAWPFGPRSGAWLAANEGFRRRVLDLLATSAPLASRDIPDTAEVTWPSTGWTNNRNVTQMLEFLSVRGEVAVAGRRGRQRLWDLAERVFPADVLVLPQEEAHEVRRRKLLRSLGVARPRVVGEVGVLAEIDGTSGVWRVDPDATAEGFAGRTALLSPFDRLIHDRARAVDLFDFEYTLEMYKPKAKRRWGYFALPVLHDDQMIGKVDAAADRRSSVLRVQAVHADVPFTREMTAAVHAELGALAEWLGLGEVHFA
ncbi:DNA glycosylase AlkZ-like family protein [Streptacidiphilus jiangxiensis]|uniref:DNA glycosylase AlkZ-like family protein n=1 Tax=Streptacidiphilus jiangxiensis TaxID=235985 RepID=UPI001F2CA3A2|nr:crosslink repair DNA glycosylase YcaQ family protein [Streptacidiphilus jiangxiensis]